jgi:hypothetical protein
MLKSRRDLQHSGTLGDNGLVKKSFRHFNTTNTITTWNMDVFQFNIHLTRTIAVRASLKVCESPLADHSA